MFRTALQQLVRAGAPRIMPQQFVRHMSASPPLVDLCVDNQTGIATLTLSRPPVNSLNLELLTAISQALDQVEENRSKGLILTSVSWTDSHNL